MAAARNPTNRHRRPGGQLKAPARTVLRHLAAHGPQARPQLFEALASFELTKLAREHTVYNLQALGYTQRVNLAGVAHWKLTELGQRAVACDATPASPPAPRQAPTPQPAPAIVLPLVAPPEPPPGARTVVWASRRVTLPNAPRSVFDLGAAS